MNGTHRQVGTMITIVTHVNILDSPLGGVAGTMTLTPDILAVTEEGRAPVGMVPLEEAPFNNTGEPATP